MELSNISKRVLELFYEISSIPRPSYHEEKIADYICDFAKKYGHEVYRDELNNVLVNVKATKGFENAEPIALQGHTDMVCEKNKDVEHDFLNEGLKLYEKDGILRAKGTTLGADDGVAVAIMLYVIEGGIEEHGDIQCVFTTSEEVGLDGVKGFDLSRIYAKKMINMDGADEDSVIVGCAGGVCSEITFNPKYVSFDGTSLTLSLGGLFGGHSGEDIAKGRSNANVLLATLLMRLRETYPFNLIAINGGSKDNAIPRECEATVALSPSASAEAFKASACELADSIRKALSDDDAGFFLNITAHEDPKNMMDEKTTADVLSYIVCSKNGVIEMSKKLCGHVEFSRNLGVIRTEEERVVLTQNSRSGIERQLDASEIEISVLASLCGAKVKHYGRYQGWAYEADSALADAYVNIFRELYGKQINKEIIHAGLECGIIKGTLTDLDCISCGPDTKNLHSPDESLNIESFGRFAYAICKLISTK